jgi:hypothetical protein
MCDVGRAFAPQQIGKILREEVAAVRSALSLPFGQQPVSGIRECRANLGRRSLKNRT